MDHYGTTAYGAKRTFVKTATSAKCRFVAKVPKGTAANFPPKNETKRQSPINAGSDPLSESPVSLAHDGAIPTLLFDRRTYGSENLSPHVAKILLQQNLPIAAIPGQSIFVQT
jgi:hypothetical protein